jgi:hypothetical protein
VVTTRPGEVRGYMRPNRDCPRQPDAILPVMTGSHSATSAAAVARRADAGSVRLSARDVAGLLLCGEHYGAPYDLLAAALQVEPARLRGIVARWRHAGYAATGRLGPGPAWCWLTPSGMAVTGLGYRATRPALARLAHIRAVLAARLWLASTAAWIEGKAWWQSERRVRAALGPGVGHGHLPDAEIRWPSLDGAPYSGQIWCIEVELTPKPVTRTSRIMAGLLSPARYAQVIYLTAPAARPVVARAVDGLPGGQRDRVAVRDLPASAYLPEP